MPQPLPIYSTPQVREIEQDARLPSARPSLMERAGLAAAEVAQNILGDGGSVLVVAGPGNNGGDALVTARILQQRWYKVDVVFSGQPDRLPADAAQALAAWVAAGGHCLSDIPAHGQWKLIVDGLFGIGLTRKLESPFAEQLARINELGALGAQVLSLDIPSGLGADNGQPLGLARAPAVQADHTVTFLCLKPGLLTADGPDYCGQLHLRTLDIAAPEHLPASGWLLEQSVVADLLQPRTLNTHKGAFGSVGILGGAESMLGAPLLAARAALKLGAGQVHVSHLSDNPPAIDLFQPELMLHRPAALFEKCKLSCLVVGPGMGRSAAAGEWLAHALRSELPLLLDADALNLIGGSSELRSLVTQRTATTLMTPHPAEAARLIGVSTHDILYQRVEVASQIASQFNAFVALKGAGTLCAMPNGSYFINSSGNPGLASAGTGDVLSGFIGALIAQGLHPRDALLMGVFLHGAAADQLAQQGIGPIGMTATDVIDAARALLNTWVYGSA